MPPSADAGPPARFATTHWTLIAAAQEPDTPAARQALAALCAAYWDPIYAFIRRQGHDAHDAEDLTQAFFARLLETDFLAAVDRAKGKFRSFLLAACGHFLANEHDRAAAWKRGGRCRVVPLDATAAEARYGAEAASALTPDKLFARRWGLALLDRVLGRLRDDWAARGRAPLFDRLRVCLLGEQAAAPHTRLAEELGLSAGAVRVAAHRLREQFRELLRDEIAHTVESPEQVEDEIRDLFAALGS
jgi:RNA polymerase sigma-70 factor (ECF subfamily)